MVSCRPGALEIGGGQLPNASRRDNPALGTRRLDCSALAPGARTLQPAPSGDEEGGFNQPTGGGPFCGGQRDDPRTGHFQETRNRRGGPMAEPPKERPFAGRSLGARVVRANAILGTDHWERRRGCSKTGTTP